MKRGARTRPTRATTSHHIRGSTWGTEQCGRSQESQPPPHVTPRHPPPPSPPHLHVSTVHTQCHTHSDTLTPPPSGPSPHTWVCMLRQTPHKRLVKRKGGCTDTTHHLPPFFRVSHSALDSDDRPGLPPGPPFPTAPTPDTGACPARDHAGSAQDVWMTRRGQMGIHDPPPPTILSGIPARSTEHRRWRMSVNSGLLPLVGAAAARHAGNRRLGGEPQRPTRDRTRWLFLPYIPS